VCANRMATRHSMLQQLKVVLTSFDFSSAVALMPICRTKSVVSGYFQHSQTTAQYIRYKVKWSITVHKMPHNYGNSCAIWDHTVLPARGDIPVVTPAEAGTRLSDPGGIQG